jgi:PAS domain S-box-containing protein
LFYYLVKESRFDFISPVVEEITGYPPEAYLANPHLLEQIVAPEDLELLRSMSLRETNEPIRMRVRKVDGGFAWLEVTYHVFRDEEGSITAYCGEAHDFTRTAEALEELRQADQYKATLLQSCPDTLFHVDAEGRVLDYLAGEPILSGPHRRAVSGLNIRQLLPIELARSVPYLVELVAETARPRRIEVVVAFEGRRRNIEAQVVPVSAHEFVCRLRDITSIKAQEDTRVQGRPQDQQEAKLDQIRKNPYQLTARELAILTKVAEGQPDKQIAERLGISTYTVNKHVGNILSKMDASSRTEAGVRALREGLLG